MKSYIYITTNKINGKKYIGQSNGKNKYYIGSGILLTKAILKYGKKNFDKEILEYCETQEELDTCEKKWISHFDAVKNPDFYNIAEGGGITVHIMKGENHPLFGTKRTEETKRKISEAQKGRVGTWIGRKHSQKSKDLIGLKNKGKIPPQKGIKMSIEKCTEQSLAQSKYWKPVMCIETSEEFKCAREAAMKFENVRSAKKAITKICNNSKICKSYKGFTYKYL